MNTTSFAKILDRKEKDRRSSLQWLFTDRANANECVRHISDRRDMGVCTTNDKKLNEKTRAETPGPHHDRNDGQGGFLALEVFTGGALTFLFQLLNAFDVADEVYLDRRKPADPHAAYAGLSYYPL